MGAEAEAQMVQVQTAFRDLPVREAMVTRFVTLPPAAPLRHAVDVLLSGTQQDFPVVDDDHLAGVLTRRDLLSALQQQGPEALVADAKRSFVPPVRADAPLEEIFQRMHAEGLPAMPVIEGRRLVGLITLENIAEFLMVRAVLEGTSMQPGTEAERVALAAERPLSRRRAKT